MKIVLRPGEKLEVGFMDELAFGLDGNLFIEFTEREIRVDTDWADSDGRKGNLYSERFSALDDAVESAIESAPCVQCGRTTPHAIDACDRWDCPFLGLRKVEGC